LLKKSFLRRKINASFLKRFSTFLELVTLVEDFVGHEDGVLCIEFADNMLYSGSFDHSIRSWNLKEMESRIRERAFMFKEDIWSRKYDAWYKVFYK